MAAGPCPRKARRQHGTIAVEVGLLIGVFFLVVVGTMEVARAIFLWNTLAHVTRRAAENVAVSAPATDHTAALAGIAFNGVPLSSPAIDSSYLMVEYLNLNSQPIAPPACPADNVRNCTQDPQDLARCIRFVRVRLCQPGGDGACNPVPYQPVLPLAGMLGSGGLNFPTFATVTPVAALGYRPGTCP